jgi:signal transduction histidine kinase
MTFPLRYSLKRRFAMHLAAFCICFAGATLLAVYWFAHIQEAALVERIVEDQMQALSGEPAESSGRARSMNFAIRSPAELKAVPPSVRNLPPGKHAVEIDSRLHHVLIRDAKGVRLITVYDEANHAAKLATFMWTLLAGLAVVIFAAALLGPWWAGAMIRQVAGLAQRADDLRSVDRDAQGGADLDETIARLAVTFDNYQSRMMEIVEREREFSSNVSHELRTPLTLIQTSCELIALDPAIGERSRRLVARIANSAEHMNDSIRSLLVLAREGNLGDNERLPIREFLLELIDPLRETVEAKGIEIKIDVGDNAFILANREALFIVMGNLVKNAVKYTDKGMIALRYVGNKLYVEDTGCGIPASDIPNIFLRFFRARAASESGREGLGLGLAIVKRICDHYGWQLDVQSTIGKGTLVSVEFVRPGHLFES